MGEQHWTHILNAVDFFQGLEGSEDDSRIRDDVYVPRAPADDHQAPRDLEVRKLVIEETRGKTNSDSNEQKTEESMCVTTILHCCKQYSVEHCKQHSVLHCKQYCVLHCCEQLTPNKASRYSQSRECRCVYPPPYRAEKRHPVRGGLGVHCVLPYDMTCVTRIKYHTCVIFYSCYMCENNIISHV